MGSSSRFCVPSRPACSVQWDSPEVSSPGCPSAQKEPAVADGGWDDFNAEVLSSSTVRRPTAGSCRAGLAAAKHVVVREVAEAEELLQRAAEGRRGERGVDERDGAHEVGAARRVCGAPDDVHVPPVLDVRVCDACHARGVSLGWAEVVGGEGHAPLEAIAP